MNENVFHLSDDAMHPVRRKIVKWEWYTDVPTCKLFFHLMLTANFKDGVWRGITIKRGQTITSLQHLSEETGLTIQQVRTAINKLKSTHEITHEPTNQFTMITLNEYETYNNVKPKSNKQGNTPSNNPSTNDQQTINKRITTIGEEREEREERERKDMCDFVELWKALPARNGKKLEKGEAFKKYKLQPLKDRAAILNAATNYANSKQVKDGIGIKDPKRFLNNWKDWQEAEVLSPNNGHGVDVSTPEGLAKYEKASEMAWDKIKADNSTEKL